MAIHGKDGNVQVGANTVADITSWSLDVSRDTHDVTAFDSASVPWREFIAGLVGATGTLEGNLDMTDTNGQLALWNSLTSDTPLTLNLFLDATHKFAASAYITGFGPQVPVGDVETVSFDFQITGAVTYT